MQKYPTDHNSCPTHRQNGWSKSLSTTATRSIAAVSAVAAIFLFGPSVHPAAAQFVCVDSANSTQGATATGGISFACGQNANAGGIAAGNTAVGSDANASGNAGLNTAIGRLSDASGDRSMNFANGYGSHADGSDSRNLVMGAFATATGDGSANIAYGSNAIARGDNSQNAAFGLNANAQGDGTSNLAIGAQSVAASNSIAFGTAANATFANSAAFGNGATTTRANQQAFGTTANTYTMAGITSAASKTAQAGPTQLVTSDTSGNLATTTLAGLGLASSADVAGISSQLGNVNSQIGTINSQLSTMNSRLNAIDNRLNEQMQEYRGGIALALASSRLAFDTRPGKFSVSAGYGNFKGTSGMAVGVGYALSADMRVNAAFTAAERGDIGASIGGSWTLN
jgi:hypothetical protein